MTDKRTFCKRFMLGTAVEVAIVVAVIGLFFGRVVEATLAEEVGTWVLMGLFLIGIFEVFAYILAPLVYHSIYEKRK